MSLPLDSKGKAEPKEAVERAPSRSAKASATIYSLIETAKANDLEPYAYLRQVLAHIGAADTPEKMQAPRPGI
ncbi:hypothetical protein JCM17961_20000 [Endothiovibrio diazotrophicus]